MISKKLLALLIVLATFTVTAQGQSGGQQSGGEQASGQNAQQVSAAGQQLYAQNCAACHQTSGEGIQSVYPTLVGSALVTGAPEGVIQILLNGRGGMPSFASDLSDEQIAAVISFVRTSWGNEAGPITPEMVGNGGGQGSESGRPGAAD